MKDFLKHHKYILGPMAGVNDAAFRSLCLQNGCDFTYTEMVSSKGLQYGSQKTRSLLHIADNEEKVAVQLFGHEPKTMADQAEEICKLLENKLAFIDINMGCPAKKIVSKGDGAALMNDPDLASSIVKECKKASGVPITAKFRRGYKLDEDTSLDFAKTLQQAGVDAICVHPRYAMQYYRGNAQWQCISKITTYVDIPVIGSGDITNKETADDRLINYGCAAIMVSRATRGNPAIFTELKTGHKSSFEERINLGIKHVELYYTYLLESRDKDIGQQDKSFERKSPVFTTSKNKSTKSNQQICNLKYLRKHAIWYVKGIPGAAIARQKFCQCVTKEDFILIFKDLLNNL